MNKPVIATIIISILIVGIVLFIILRNRGNSSSDLIRTKKCDDPRAIITRLGNYYVKKYKRGMDQLYNREKDAYVRLKNTNIIPSVVTDDVELKLVMDDVGEPLTRENMPKDYTAQALNIMKILRDRNVSHNDLWSGNIMVNDGRLRIIDFEHATLPGQVPKFFRNDNLLDISSVLFEKTSPLYIGTTETLQEIVSLCETSHERLPGTTSLCSVIGGMSVLSILSNPTINPQKILLYDVDDSQCMLAQVYLELIEQSDTLSQFIRLLYSSHNATELTLNNMVTQIAILDGTVRPVFSTKTIHDFYYHKMLPRIMRSKYHDLPTELWPCWNDDADKELVYQNSTSNNSNSMYLRGDPVNIRKANTLYYGQGGWLLDNDRFMETKHNLQRAEIRIVTANLRNMHTLYKQLDLGESDNLVFFVSNADQGTEWTGGRNTLKTELKKVMKPTQNILYIAADHHDVL